MSSSAVRTDIKGFITTNFPAENQVDLTALYSTLENVLSDSGIGVDDPWLGIEFTADLENPQSVPADNTQGCYREEGAVTLNVVEVARLGVDTTIISRAEALINAFRGQRIGDILIESVSPPNFSAGSTLDFEGGYVSASVILIYQYERKL